MNYELTDAGLVTSDPVIAASFLNEMVFADWARVAFGHTNDWKEGRLGACDIGVFTILIPYPLIKAAYQPVEGEGAIYEDGLVDPSVALRVFTYISGSKCYHKKVLNIVTTRAELRELIEVCEG